MKDKELITVVVPIYKSEEYLQRCIDSIITQTYSNLEIILVDDGSPDNSGKICDEYSKKDNRVKVVHKINEGVSEARNVGIRSSEGKYITFVDSDDYIAKDYIEYLYKMLKENDCDISVCSFLEFKDVINNGSDVVKSQKILNNVEAFNNLCYQKDFTTACWGKLYHITLFDKVEFPFGVNCGEDLATMYKVFYKANKIIVSNEKKYYYFKREGSLTSSNFSLKRIHAVNYAKEIVSFAINNNKDMVNSAINRLFMESVFVLIQIPKNKFKDEQKMLYKIIKENRITVIKDNKSRLSYRIIALISYLGSGAIRLIFNIRNKVGE